MMTKRSTFLPALLLLAAMLAVLTEPAPAEVPWLADGDLVGNVATVTKDEGSVDLTP